jgi:hypothetical protein
MPRILLREAMNDVEQLLIVTKCLLEYAQELLAEKDAKDFR